MHPTWHGTYGVTLMVAIVALSGFCAWAHATSRSPAGLAIWGALTGTTALGALFLGVLLHG